VGVAARHGVHITFTQWTRYGIPPALLSIAICVPYLLICYT
jgi:Na+/H+ antiporter NhaD/arsenite permease-like protein